MGAGEVGVIPIAIILIELIGVACLVCSLNTFCNF